MKHIRLSVAQRYLKLYPDAHLECTYDFAETLKLRYVPTQDIRHIRIVYTPKASVYLTRFGTRIAQITKGLPTVNGSFDAFSGEFRQGIPY